MRAMPHEVVNLARQPYCESGLSFRFFRHTGCVSADNAAGRGALVGHRRVELEQRLPHLTTLVV